MITQESVMASGQLAGRVKRYHTWPMLREQTVAAHACRVAILYVELWGMPRAEVLYVALRHDDGELAAGDTPFYAKREVPELGEQVRRAEEIGLMNLGANLPELTDTEKRQLKMADLCEMWETAVVELNMGNLYAGVVLRNLRPAIGRLAANLRDAVKMDLWILQNMPEEKSDGRY